MILLAEWVSGLVRRYIIFIPTLCPTVFQLLHISIDLTVLCKLSGSKLLFSRLKRHSWVNSADRSLMDSMTFIPKSSSWPKVQLHCSKKIIFWNFSILMPLKIYLTQEFYLKLNVHNMVEMLSAFPQYLFLIVSVNSAESI